MNITAWIERKFEEGYFYLIRLLSGHGYFCKHLFNMGKMARPNCIYGDASIDGDRWRLKRKILDAKVGGSPIENYDVIQSSEENWNIMVMRPC